MKSGEAVAISQALGLLDFGMRANMPRTSDRHVNEKPFRIALNLRESAPFYPLDLQKIVKSKGTLTTKDLKTLQERTFYGKEKKSLAYVIAIMNMILHGIEAPNIVGRDVAGFSAASSHPARVRLAGHTQGQTQDGGV